MDKKVIDVSYAQGNINFEKIKNSGIKDIIIRTGYLYKENFFKTDDYFEKNIKGAIENGFNIGVYTYIKSKTIEQAKQEALGTVKLLNEYKGYINYPVFCDMEDGQYINDTNYDKRIRTDIILTFCQTIREQGYYPAVYINPAWLENYINKTEIIKKYDIWLAAWTGSPEKATRYNYGQKMWQWGCQNIAGISGVVDSDIVYIDYPEVVKKTGLNFLRKKETEQNIFTNKTENVKYIMQPLGSIAVRTDTSKDDMIIGRTDKTKYYTVDQIITQYNGKWVKFRSSSNYSMLEENGVIYFSKISNYNIMKAIDNVNIREEPSLKGNKVTVLDKGKKIVAFSNDVTVADNLEWQAVLFNGKKLYISKKYLKEVVS